MAFLERPRLNIDPVREQIAKRQSAPTWEFNSTRSIFNLREAQRRVEIGHWRRLGDTEVRVFYESKNRPNFWRSLVNGRPILIVKPVGANVHIEPKHRGQIPHNAVGLKSAAEVIARHEDEFTPLEVVDAYSNMIPGYIGEGTVLRGGRIRMAYRKVQ